MNSYKELFSSMTVADRSRISNFNIDVGTSQLFFKSIHSARNAFWEIRDSKFEIRCCSEGSSLQVKALDVD